MMVKTKFLPIRQYKKKIYTQEQNMSLQTHFIALSYINYTNYNHK